MLKSFCILPALALLLGCSQISNVQSQTPQVSLPVLKAVSGTDTVEIKLSSLHVEVRVIGNIAVTTLDLDFYNPLDKVLEGEMELPLADGQNVSRYALDMEGAMREGVVVEKAKARVAFENTVRRGIDPGLIEKTRGNYFRTRIYPLPARGHKRVIIGIEEALTYSGGAYLYQLPLHTGQVVGRFSIKALVAGAAEKPKLSRNEVPVFSFSASANQYKGEVSHSDFLLNKLFAFSIPVPKDSQPLIYTGSYGSKTCFYTNTILASQSRPRPQPASIGVLWDVSASAEKRNRQKELDLLESSIARWKDTRIILIPFHIAPEPPEEFVIRNGNGKDLIQRLKSIEADGGTQLGALDLNQYQVEEFLLFSEGVSTFGKKEIILSGKPVSPISSSASADFSYLKYIARETKGRFIDLNQVDTQTAAREMGQQALQVISIQAVEGAVDDLVTTFDPLNGTLSVAGILKTATAALRVQLGYDKNSVVETRTIPLSKAGACSDDYVKRIWASMKIGELDLQYEKNKALITALGKEFSIVTRNTSLLVLDRVEDYVEHEITPPAELLAEYTTLLKEKQQDKTDEMEEAYQEALAAMKGLKEWWNRKYPAKVNSSEVDTTVMATTDTTVTAVDYGSARFTTIATDTFFAPPPPPRNAEERVAGLEVEKLEEVAIDVVSQKGVSDEGMAEVVVTMGKNEVTPLVGSIELNKWKADAVYLQTLEHTPAKDRLSKYYQLKKQYRNQPSFYVDVARLFYEHKESRQALRILSNVSELKMEDAELLRVMAYQMLEMERVDLAIETFREVLNLREEEPHSLRDLALACSEAGNYNEAVRLLYQLVLGRWDERFHGIKAIALNELNAIISAHKQSIDLSGIDPVFIDAMPVDIRIVIGWSSNDSDLDLWVTDPRGEKCFYQHQETVIGGKISEDMTGGYGPEEYCLKKAASGEYVVEANLYGDSRQTLAGPITIKAELFTDFGKPSQKRQVIKFRVATDKEVVKIGSLKFSK